MAPVNGYIVTQDICGVAHTIVVVTLSGGVQGRTYQTQLDVQMTNGRLFSFLVSTYIPIIIQGEAYVPAPSPNFCTPILTQSGGGNPLIAPSGTTTSPFEWTFIPNVGIYLDGQLTFPGPSINYVGVNQPNMTALTISNAFSYVNPTSGFTMTANACVQLSLPTMENFIGNFSPTMNALTTLSLGSLASVNGAFTPTFNTLTNMSLPALVTMDGAFTLTCPALQVFSLGAGLLCFTGSVSIQNAALTQASVDGILVSLSLLNGTNGTTLYQNQTISLQGGTSSAPSSIGIAARNILLGNGNEIFFN